MRKMGVDGHAMTSPHAQTASPATPRLIALAAAAPAPGLPARLRRIRGRLARLPMPSGATPLAAASLAIYLVQCLDHGVYRMQPLLALVLTGSLVVLFVSLFLALTRPARPLTVGCRPGTALLIVLLAGNTIVQTVVAIPHLTRGQRYTNDAVAVTDCAATMVIHGGNPYKNVHMMTCLYSHGLNSGSTTPKQAGAFRQFRSYPSPGAVTYKYMQYITFLNDLKQERLNPNYLAPDFENRFNYPGAAVYLAIPALLIGLHDLIPLYLGFTIAAALLIYRKTRPRFRPVTALLLLGNTSLLIDGVGGLTDATYALFLMLYWFTRERVLAAGLLLGLAVATRQQAWFFVPFLLYLGWHEGGWSDLWRRGGLMIAVFVGFNLQFIIMSPSDWAIGVIGPMRDPLFALGVGLIDLSIAKILPLMPASAYLAMEAVAYVAAFVYFARNCARR